MREAPVFVGFLGVSPVDGYCGDNDSAVVALPNCRVAIIKRCIHDDFRRAPGLPTVARARQSDGPAFGIRLNAGAGDVTCASVEDRQKATLFQATKSREGLIASPAGVRRDNDVLLSLRTYRPLLYNIGLPRNGQLTKLDLPDLAPKSQYAVFERSIVRLYQRPAVDNHVVLCTAALEQHLVPLPDFESQISGIAYLHPWLAGNFLLQHCGAPVVDVAEGVQRAIGLDAKVDNRSSRARRVVNQVTDNGVWQENSIAFTAVAFALDAWHKLVRSRPFPQSGPPLKQLLLAIDCGRNLY
jgi:hypothetical protein